MDNKNLFFGMNSMSYFKPKSLGEKYVVSYLDIMLRDYIYNSNIVELGKAMGENGEVSKTIKLWDNCFSAFESFSKRYTTDGSKSLALTYLTNDNYVVFIVTFDKDNLPDCRVEHFNVLKDGSLSKMNEFNVVFYNVVDEDGDESIPYDFIEDRETTAPIHISKKSYLILNSVRYALGDYIYEFSDFLKSQTQAVKEHTERIAREQESANALG